MSCNCNINIGELSSNNRHKTSQSIIVKNENEIEIVYSKEDTLDDFEAALLEINSKSSSSIYRLKKKISSYVFSVVSVVIIMFALLSTSLYEDVFKKILFESPLNWNINDSISMLFVLLFFFGLVMMPSILQGESSQLKNVLQSWFNKDAKRLKRINHAFEELDKKYQIKIYNIGILEEEHWMWKLVVPTILEHFIEVDFYIRNDQKKFISNRLKNLGVLGITIDKEKDSNPSSNVEILLSSKESSLFNLMHLSSTNIIGRDFEKRYVSLELFEYCGRSFFTEKKDNSKSLISGFQNFINRCFDDFYFLNQEESGQVSFTSIVKEKKLDDEKRRLSYFLRNHIEECLEYFDNPISLLILYYYVKDIVLDEKRMIAILEKFISSIKKKQHYSLIDNYWFEIAGEMFDSEDIENFELTNNSLYRKLSVDSLNELMFLFERNGYFEQALLLAKYLYEINPHKYSIDICSLYERSGQFDKAYNSLPKDFKIANKQDTKPKDIDVRYLQRKAWIIVSQRREEDKQEGLESLEGLKDLLFSHTDDNEPLSLWHYYNIKANYCEWNENYDEAILNYKKCLAIPALGAFEYGGTFVNMAIALRFKYLTNDSQNIDTIKQSIIIGDKGLVLKESVGDRDELPVVLHNQALNILYKLINHEDEKLTLEVINLTNKGIKILDSTDSIKRLGILLCENIIAKSILKQDVSFLTNRLQEHWEKMDEYEKKQISMIYDCFIAKGICKSLDIIN